MVSFPRSLFGVAEIYLPFTELKTPTFALSAGKRLWLSNVAVSIYGVAAGNRISLNFSLYTRQDRVILESGAEGSRTLDLLNAIQALSQLSYGPGMTCEGVDARLEMVTVTSHRIDCQVAKLFT